MPPLVSRWNFFLASKSVPAVAESKSIRRHAGLKLGPVFQAILSNATQICGAEFGVLHMAEGDAFRTVALHNAPLDYAESKRRDPTVRYLPKDSALARVRATLAPVQIGDVLAEAAYTDASVNDNTSRLAFTGLTGVRSLVAVPMLKDGVLLGAIVIYRTEVRPFTDKQIELVRISPPRRSSRSRTRDCSTSCAKRCSSRPPPPTCSKSSAVRPGELEPVFQPCWRTRCAYARPSSVLCTARKRCLPRCCDA